MSIVVISITNVCDSNIFFNNFLLDYQQNKIEKIFKKVENAEYLKIPCLLEIREHINFIINIKFGKHRTKNIIKTSHISSDYIKIIVCLSYAHHNRAMIG